MYCIYVAAMNFKSSNPCVWLTSSIRNCVKDLAHILNLKWSPKGSSESIELCPAAAARLEKAIMFLDFMLQEL